MDYYKYWQAELPLDEAETVRKAFLVDETIYLATDRGVLYAVHADIGTIRWSIRLGEAGTQIYKPCHVRAFYGKDLTLVITTGGAFYVDRESGDKVARAMLHELPTSAAVSDGVRFYVGGLNCRFYAYEFSKLQDRVAVSKRWEVATDGVLGSTPVLWSDLLFFASGDGKVRCCLAEDKTGQWVFRADGGIKSDIVVDSTGVYFGSEDRSIYKLDVYTGKGLWRVRTPGIILTPPVLVGEALYQKVEDNGVYAVDADSGEVLWKNPLLDLFVSAPEGGIIFRNNIGDLVRVHPQTGQMISCVYAPQVEDALPNPQSGAMYLLDARGRILCAQQKHVPYLRLG